MDITQDVMSIHMDQSKQVLHNKTRDYFVKMSSGGGGLFSCISSKSATLDEDSSTQSKSSQIDKQLRKWKQKEDKTVKLLLIGKWAALRKKVLYGLSRCHTKRRAGAAPWYDTDFSK